MQAKGFQEKQEDKCTSARRIWPLPHPKAKFKSASLFIRNKTISNTELKSSLKHSLKA